MDVQAVVSILNFS